MKVKSTDLGTFVVCPGENGRFYYHDGKYGYLDNAQSWISTELYDNRGGMITHSARNWLVLVSYPDGEWVKTGKLIPRESGIISDPEKVFEHGEAHRFQIPLILEICERCRGKGTMGNPSLNGTSIEWWQEHGGPDWQEDIDEYMHGDMYDVQCEFHCSQGKAFGVDWPFIIEQWQIDPEENNEYATKIRQHIEDYNEYQAERRSEERWGY
jgi:hypothetical protein